MAAKVMMESISHVESSFTSATHQEHVRPMFKVGLIIFMISWVGCLKLTFVNVASNFKRKYYKYFVIFNGKVCGSFAFSNKK